MARVAHYIRSRTRPQQQPAGGANGASDDDEGAAGGWRRGGGNGGAGAAMAPFQSIVISLKDNFYEKVG